MRQPRGVRGRVVLLCTGFVMLVLAAGCVPGRLVYTSGPYRGTVVDAESKKPLVGAVVLAVWFQETIVLVAAHGPAVEYHDSLEVLADSSGEFVVPEKTHVTLLGKIREPDFVVYYPGYAPYPSLKARPQGKEVDAAYEQKVFHVELSRLKTHQERLEHARIPVDVDHRIPEAKIANLIRLVNSERKALGLQPIGGWEKTE